jgi:hypothetical protein
MSRAGISTWLAVVVTAACMCPGRARSADEVLPEVVVTGEQPGPGLWQVLKGDHVLWVLGTVKALPKHVKWKADGVDRILASSQVVLSNPALTLDSDIGPFSAMLLVPSLIGVEDLPDGATLGQVLPPPIYARWTVQRQKYLGDSARLERLRPFIAADDLASVALKRAGLTDDEEIISAVHKLVKKYHVKNVDATYRIFVKDPKAVIKKFKKTPLDESACFSYRLDELEYSLAQSALQANAWATGNIPALQSSLEKQPKNPCWHGLGDISFFKDLGITDVLPSVDDAWLTAAEKSLSEHQVSFALLDMDNVLLPDGLIAMMKSRGYTVLAPDQAPDAPR